MIYVKNIVLGVSLCAVSVAMAAETDNAEGVKWTYQQCLDYAFEKNISLQQKILTNQSDAATLEQSKAQWLPTVDFSTTHGLTNYAAPADGTSRNSYAGTYGLNASWLVYNGNIRQNQIKYDELQQQISQLGIEDYRYTLKTEILTRYLNILYAKEAITIAEDNLNVSEYQMERAEALMNSGKLSRVDYTQIESQYYSDKYSLTQAKTSLATAKTSLKTLLELNIGTEFDVADIQFNDSELESDLPRKTDVFYSACSWVPALKQYKLAGEAGEYGVDIAKGGYYPQISLNAGVGTSNNTGANGNYGQQLKERLNEQVSVSLSVPILDQKKNKTAVTKAKIEKLNADLNLQSATTTLSQTIESIYTDAENAQSQYESCKEKVKSAKMTDQLVNEQFTLGLVNTLELLNAHSSLLSAQQELLQAKYMTILNKRLLEFYQTQEITLN